ncbi:MAG: hypothetical protein WDW36_006361 [Sanguina aurantia]
MASDTTAPPVDAPAVAKLSTGKRFVAAAASAALATTTVNPFDVIKTRLQAHAASLPASTTTAAAAAPQPFHAVMVQACDHIRLQYEAIRAPRGFTPTAHPSYPNQAYLHQLNCVAASSHPHFSLHTPTHPPAWRQSCHRLTAACCSLAHPATLSHELHHTLTAGAYAAAPAAATASPLSASAILRTMLRQDGVFVLWRGLDGALATSIPMVSIYMPLYDAMMHAYAPTLGPYSPVLCGVAARAVAVVAVAPLELTRTRQQAASAAAAATALAGGTTGRPESALATLRHFLTAAAVSTGGSTGGGVVFAETVNGVERSVTVREIVRALPKLWTGVAATMARDLPFSAIYWGLAEPLRGLLLPALCAPARPVESLPYHKAIPSSPPPSTASTASTATAAATPTPASPPSLTPTTSHAAAAAASVPPIPAASAPTTAPAAPAAPAASAAPSAPLTTTAATSAASSSSAAAASAASASSSAAAAAPLAMSPVPAASVSSPPRPTAAGDRVLTAPQPSPHAASTAHLAHTSSPSSSSSSSAAAAAAAEPMSHPCPKAAATHPHPATPRPFASSAPPSATTAAAATAHSSSGSSGGSSSGGGGSGGSTDPTQALLTPSGAQVMWANLIAGSVAGGVAAVATTPFDVIKTRLQIAGVGSGTAAGGILGMARDVVRTAGARGLFLGGGLRAARSAPACAIVIAGYELFKLALQ